MLASVKTSGSYSVENSIEYYIFKFCNNQLEAVGGILKALWAWLYLTNTVKVPRLDCEAGFG